MALAKPIPHPLYVGIAIQYQSVDEHHPRFGVYVHDGFWSWDFYERGFPKSTIHINEEKESNSNRTELDQEVVKHIQQYQHDKQCKIIMAGLVNCNDARLVELGKRLWFELDVVPCILTASGSALDEKACSVARKTSQYICPTGIPGLCKVNVGYRHEVEVDANGRIAFCTLDDYKKYFCRETWDELLRTAELVKQLGKRIVFVNSTPQGGGVAIIRHSTIRIFKLLGIDAHWFVMKPNPEIFEITKKKFHNVLQGVATPDTDLSNREMYQYIRWCTSNVEHYWSAPDCPMNKADVIVIDDPQPCAMIPRLKKLNPNACFVYRSHIEIRSDLIRDDSTIQHKVWKILWKYISLCDVFVSHPVEKFIPDDVRKSSMVIKQFPAVTDPCDGLNKKLDDYSTMYYRLLFNRIAYDQLERKVDFARPYFVQISRFDPSKGIPDLINAYIEFRKTMASERHRDVSKLPQLVITGHGSIDDPEGHIIHRDIMDLMETMRNDVDVSDEYVDDIVVVRLGPSDQMLNAVLSGAKAAFQLSLREGFEVKVSEALLKSVPVVVYASGGIPLQVRDGVDGHLVSTGDFRKVAKIMRDITVNDDHYNKLKNRAGKDNREWILTPSNILHWNYIMLNGNEQIPEPIQPNKPGIVPGAVKP